MNFNKSGIFSVFWELKLLYDWRKSFKKFETGEELPIIVPCGHWSLKTTSGDLETTSQFGTWKRLLGNECGSFQRLQQLWSLEVAVTVGSCVDCWKLRGLLEAAATSGSCGDCWKLRRVAGKAYNMIEKALSILIVIFSIQLQQTETSDRKLFIFQPCGKRHSLH